MIDRAAAARAIDDFLRALGHEPTGELEGTGQRVADAFLDDLLAGESVDAGALLLDGSMEQDEDGGLVAIRGLSVVTMCPHHLLPAIGSGVVVYRPGRRVAGLGRIAHVVDAVARRLTIQERIGTTVVDLLIDTLGARGAGCALSLTHGCLVARGERQAHAVVDTLAMGGAFAEPGADRDAALAMLRGRA